MKQFNLEEYIKNPSKKVITRDGRNVRIICTDAKTDYPIIALVKEQYNDKEELSTFTKNGLWKLSANRGLNDLFFAPEKHEGWINLYRPEGLESVYTANVYDSKDEAEYAAQGEEDYLTTVKIEWEE